MTNLKQAIQYRTKLSNQIIHRLQRYGVTGYDVDECIEAVRRLIELRTGTDAVRDKADYEAAVIVMDSILPEVVA